MLGDRRLATVIPLYEDALERSRSIASAAQPPLLDLVSYLPEDILTKVDRASMAVSLEVRAPILDHRVVEYALTLPGSLKRRGRTTKWLLRRLLYRRVPRKLLDRPKMGFSVPLDDWLRGPLREQMSAYCASDTLESLGIDPEPTRRIWKNFLTSNIRRSELLWQMFALMAWAAERPRSARDAAAQCTVTLRNL
jgi:asparagine synthase (glutamine-hydrolysing)